MFSTEQTLTVLIAKC